MKAIFKVLPVLALVAASSQAWSQATAVDAAVDAARLRIPHACGLAGWQFALTLNAQDQVTVELSPTIAREQILCVYQTLSDNNIPLDRPALVEVKQNSIRAMASSSSN